jgi:uracil-DNA glycosylase
MNLNPNICGVAEVVVNGVRYVTNAEGWFVPYEEPEPKPEAGLAPFWWETRPISADAAHEATMAMGKGQR